MEGRASTRIRPWLSTGTRITRSRPSPTIPNALISEGWTSSPTTTVTSGAPNRPWAVESQPTSERTWDRAADRVVTWATVVPVTKAPQVVLGNPLAWMIHRNALASSATEPGVASADAEFWSQAEVSQSAARATG